MSISQLGQDRWVLQQTKNKLRGYFVEFGAVLAANTTVVKNVNSYEIVGGNPGTVIKKRFDMEIVELLLKLKWWDLPTESIKKIQDALCSSPSKTLLEELIVEYR